VRCGASGGEEWKGEGGGEKREKADHVQIDRQKRHTDRQVVADFWRVLDIAKR
jgi:hypothetical protein